MDTITTSIFNSNVIGNINNLIIPIICTVIIPIVISIIKNFYTISISKEEKKKLVFDKITRITERLLEIAISEIDNKNFDEISLVVLNQLKENFPNISIKVLEREINSQISMKFNKEKFNSTYENK